MKRTIAVIVAALGSSPAAAVADGLPVGNVEVGAQGVTRPGVSHRYVALRTGEATVVAKVERRDGRVVRFREIGERLTVPGVALDRTADGLSADGRTLVLIRPRGSRTFPQARTRLVVFDARALRVRRRITLRGDFSFDALSPDGRRMFLVHYVSPRDPRKYVVRSYDLQRGALEPGAIVDAREPDEDMRGFPLTRLTTRDGRWAYTLYDGGGEPFVHALDTRDREAACIDLPMLAGDGEPYELRLVLDGGSLLVTDAGSRGKPVAAIDTETFRATRPRVASAAPKRRTAREPDDGLPDAWLIAAGATALALTALAARRRMKTSRA